MAAKKKVLNRQQIMREILMALSNTPEITAFWSGCDDGILTILDIVMDLTTKPSTDSRFQTARDDIRQHRVINEDWTYQDLFFSYLTEISSQWEIFSKFIAACVHPYATRTKDDQEHALSLFEPILVNYSLKLIVQDYFQGIPVYRLIEAGDEHMGLPPDIADNTIPFFTKKEIITSYPCFLLKKDIWNDWFKWETRYMLSYLPNPSFEENIGLVRIMRKDVLITSEVLPETFYQLGADEKYCSLGHSIEYYKNLKRLFPQSYMSVLSALQDAAVFPSVRSEYEEDPAFSNSLCRDSDQSRLLDSARFVLAGISIKDHYKFTYLFHPHYSQEAEYKVPIPFLFTYTSSEEDILQKRIYCIVGKNGAGKTSLLSEMAKDFQKDLPNTFIPRKPFFNRVMSISFSFFNCFAQPKKNVGFNYTYLGLSVEEDPRVAIKVKLTGYLKRINDSHRVNLWIHYIEPYLHLSRDCYRLDQQDKDADVIMIDRLKNEIEHLSSGESMLIYIVSCLLAEMREHTLLLFDEPELNLHPNAISMLIDTLNQMLIHYDSFCILATHSPFVVKEIPSSNVLVFNREQDELLVRPVGVETFSESVGVIGDDVFDNRHSGRYYKDMIRTWCRTYKDYDRVVEKISQNDLPPSLGLRLFIRQCIDEELKAV